MGVVSPSVSIAVSVRVGMPSSSSSSSQKSGLPSPSESIRPENASSRSGMPSSSTSSGSPVENGHASSSASGMPSPSSSASSVGSFGSVSHVPTAPSWFAILVAVAHAAAVGVGGTRVGGRLGSASGYKATRSEIGIRVGAAAELEPVGESVPVRVAEIRVRAERNLVAVGDAVVVRVARRAGSVKVVSASVPAARPSPSASMAIGITEHVGEIGDARVVARTGAIGEERLGRDLVVGRAGDESDGAVVRSMPAASRSSSGRARSRK